MIERPPDRTRGAAPARQLAAFIARFDPPVAKLARAARAVLRKRLPAANELVYDNYNALAIGFAPTERTSDCILSLAVYARGVNLYFFYGATLPDPERRLQGQGHRGRFVRLASAADLKQPAIDTLISEAVRQSDAPLPRRGRGRIVIKSISAQQRPRRPARRSAL